MSVQRHTESKQILPSSESATGERETTKVGEKESDRRGKGGVGKAPSQAGRSWIAKQAILLKIRNSLNVRTAEAERVGRTENGVREYAPSSSFVRSSIPHSLFSSSWSKSLAFLLLLPSAFTKKKLVLDRRPAKTSWIARKFGQRIPPGSSSGWLLALAAAFFIQIPVLLQSPTRFEPTTAPVVAAVSLVEKEKELIRWKSSYQRAKQVLQRKRHPFPFVKKHNICLVVPLAKQPTDQRVKRHRSSSSVLPMVPRYIGYLVLSLFLLRCPYPTVFLQVSV